MFGNNSQPIKTTCQRYYVYFFVVIKNHTWSHGWDTDFSSALCAKHISHKTVIITMQKRRRIAIKPSFLIVWMNNVSEEFRHRLRKTQKNVQILLINKKKNCFYI